MNPISIFDRYFSVELAVSEAQREQVYALRYRVYCKEFGFLPESLPALHDAETDVGHVEHDEFDDRSYHVLVKHRQSGLPAACVRLVTTAQSMYEDPLPLEYHCLEALSVEALDMLNQHRETVGEISRLAVDPLFRRPRADLYRELGYEVEQEFSVQERKVFPFIGVAALMGAAVVATITDRTTVFAMMDAALWRRLKGPGFHFQRIGKSVDYHGRRAPYRLTAEAYLAHIPENLRAYYRLLSDRFVSEYGESLGVCGFGKQKAVV